MTNQPDAFLSYTRLDDEFFGGAITSLRKLIELGVQVIAGQKSFKIYQDVDGLEFGEQWQKGLDQAVTTARFLVPVVTPLFFQSEACRDELTKFITHESEQGRDDLILPLYFVTVPALEKQELLRDDPLAEIIASRQRYDWRSKADLPINDPQVKAAVRQLSEKIGIALARVQGDLEAKGRPGAPTTASEGHKVAAFSHASNVIRSEEPQKKSTKLKRVLWVDDRPDNNVYERRAMEAYNVEFELAETTGEALAKLRKTQFDAIISDMGRPPDAQAGYTLLNSLRSSGNLTPFFIYAGSNSPEHLRLALSKGAQGSTNRANILINEVLTSLNG
ncbi:TIR domain-containing protein [Bradyrhizobium liaoningense]|uniref:TIR domain-containing protein n=1 Tax=Bradyrhizobium liaoningense TaxID=43992 RepID=UPI001BACEA37|nr:TIR domain-containing protein [Bradyrhizobium liaoningense]